MKKLLLLLLLPILSIGQVNIVPSESHITIKIDTVLSVQQVKVYLYDLQGKLVQASILVDVTTNTETNTDDFKLSLVPVSDGIYSIHIQFNAEYLRKLIYNK